MKVIISQISKVNMHKHCKIFLLILVIASIFIIFQTVVKNKTLDPKIMDKHIFNEQEHSSWLPVYSLPRSSSEPNTMYYIWCGKRVFEFQHYLSVLSVIHYLNPDNIVFMFDVAPTVDGSTYNTWFQELSTKHGFIRCEQMKETDFGCVGMSQPNMTFLHNLLIRRGGIYINETIVLSNPLPQYHLSDIVVGLNNRTEMIHLLAKRRYKNHTFLYEDGKKNNSFECVDVAQFNTAREVPLCVYLTSHLYPKDIWEVDNAFGRLARTVFYGTPEIQRPEPTYQELIPNIGHVVWIGRGEMDFLFYLCVLSLIHIAKVDTIYIHGDGPPTGMYWDLIKNDSKIHCIYRDPPIQVHGHIVNGRSHVSDAWRVDFMVKYGGIYMDTDAVFVKPLSRELRGYEAVGSYDWPQGNLPFQDIINFGVAIGKRGAPFWHKDSMGDFRDHDWTWNGLRQPYKIQERFPKLVHIDPHLQVICYFSLCHPTWWPDYHNEQLHHQNIPPGMSLDWRKDAFAFHWTHPTPTELQSHKLLLSGNSTFSEIGKYILEKAGMMEYFKRI